MPILSPAVAFRPEKITPNQIRLSGDIQLSPMESRSEMYIGSDTSFVIAWSKLLQ